MEILLHLLVHVGITSVDSDMRHPVLFSQSDMLLWQGGCVSQDSVKSFILSI